MLCSTPSPPLPSHWTLSSHSRFCCLCSIAFFRMLLRMLQNVVFSNWLKKPLYNSMDLRFRRVFLLLIVPCLLSMNNSPLFFGAAVVNFLKDILVASSFWSMWIELLEMFMCRFLLGGKFLFGWITRSMIAGLYGKPIFTLVRNCEIVF